jgi:hypothetical protein
MEILFKLLGRESYITFSLCVEIKVCVLYTFRLTFLELLLESLRQHVLIASSFLQKIYENDKSVVIHHVCQVFVKCLRSQFVISLYRSVSLDALLLPEQWNATSNLHK